MRPQTILRRLLLSLLTTDELRRLLFDLFGREVLDAVPREGTDESIFFEAVEVLDKRGLVTEPLFQALADHAPGRLREIAEVAVRWGLPAPITNVIAGDALAPFEELPRLLREAEPSRALEFMCAHAEAFFPARSNVATGTRISYRLVLPTEGNILLVERLTISDGTSGLIWTTGLVLAGVDAPLLSRGPSGWQVSEACAAFVKKYRRAPVYGAQELALFLGRRSQLLDDAAKDTWRRFKGQLHGRHFSVHTTDGFIAYLAEQAFGADWHARLPPRSPLLSPL